MVNGHACDEGVITYEHDNEHDKHDQQEGMKGIRSLEHCYWLCMKGIRTAVAQT